MKNNLSLRQFLFVIILGYVISPCIIVAESIASIEPKHLIINDHNANSSIQLLSIAHLTNISINGIKVSELSGIVWDEDEGLLYAVSDNGFLLHFKPVFDGEKITDILFTAGYALHDEKNNQLKWKMADSEGITVKHNNNGKKNDTEIFISFERFPRIIQFNNKGQYLAEIGLPPALKNKNDYKSENKMLESITYHHKFGLLTGIEVPLNVHTSPGLYIFSMNNNIWRFNVNDEQNGSLVGMTVTTDGNLLLLERAYYALWQKINTTIHEVSLTSDQGDGLHIARYQLPNEIFNENFEGITHYRDNFFFMISDDNNHPFKRTSLVFFKINKN